MHAIIFIAFSITSMCVGVVLFWQLNDQKHVNQGLGQFRIQGPFASEAEEGQTGQTRLKGFRVDGLALAVSCLQAPVMRRMNHADLGQLWAQSL